MGESFEEFKKSFSYGSRSDLSFKFLKGLRDEDAAQFFSELLNEVGELYDGASSDRLIDLAFEWQVNAYTPKPDAKRHYVYEDRPFQQLTEALANTTLGLVTSSGHYALDDPPADSRPDQTQAETAARVTEYLKEAPDLSAIPVDTPDDNITVKHPGYDIRSASRDLNVAFPVRLLEELASKGRIGRVADHAYSFVGACAQGRLRKELDGWVELWKSAGVEALFLVPV